MNKNKHILKKRVGFGLKDLGSNPNVYQPDVPGQWVD